MPATAQFHVEHIIPPGLWGAFRRGELPLRARRSDAGPDHLDNFAWSCPFCNYAKGQQVAGQVGRRAVRLFHPRRDRWATHFLLVEQHLLIVGGSDIGRVTVAALGFNDARPNGPLVARHRAILSGTYPPPWARRWSTDA